MSPTGMRSTISYSQDHDQFNSLSKGSVRSSGDDDVDSLQSAYVGSLDRLNLKKAGAIPSKKPFSSSKKREVSSAPKKSFDSALRQMDPRKAPQNMFRPLLSNVPSSTFHAGNSISMQHSLVSRNSSVTTRSHTSTEHGIGMTLDMDGSDEAHDGMARKSAEGINSGVEPEIFEFDESEAANEDLESESCQENRLVNIQLNEFSEEPRLDNISGDAKGHVHSSMLIEMTATSEVSHGSVDLHRIQNTENLVVCSVCGYEYDDSCNSERDGEVCPECRRKGNNLDNAVSELEPILTEFIEGQSVGLSEEHMCLDKSNFSTASFKSQRSTRTDERRVLKESNEQQVAFSSHNRLMDAGKNELAKEEGFPPAAVGSDQPDAISKNQTLSLLNNLSKGDGSEATGMPLLLARSGSIKGPVIQGRTFTVSAIPRDDLSYARDSTSSMRSSYGRDSVSRSPSIDYGSRQTDHLAHSHLHSLKSSTDGLKYDIRSQSMDSSFSGTSENAQQCLGVFPTVHGDCENTIANDGDNTMEGTVQSLELVHRGDSNLSNKVLSTSVNLENEQRIGSEDDVAAHGRLGTSDIHEDASSQGEICSLMKRWSDTLGCSDVPAVSSTDMSETETLNCEFSSVSDDDASPKHIALNKSSEPFNGEKTTAVPELGTSGLPHDIRGTAEESTVVMVEARGGTKARSLTLEEATDTILFCSSIVHDLAYKAATISIEKEDEIPLEGSRPTVTILGKSATDVKDPPRRGRVVSKRASRGQKARPMPIETKKRSPTSVTENDENVDGSLSHNIGLLPSKVDTEKPPKLESKCNCTIM